MRKYLNFGFINELFLFAITQVIGLWVAFNYIAKALNTPIVGSNVKPISAIQFIVAFFIATLIILALSKFVKNPLIIKIIFYLGIAQGAFLFFNSFLSWQNAIIGSIFLLILYFFYSNIFIHNFVLILALSALAVYFGFNFKISTLIIILILLAVYDYWAVYKTKHMVSMFKNLSDKKVNFSLIVPINFKSYLIKLNFVSTDNQFMFLGTGDIVIPLIFTISCLNLGWRTALFAFAGSILGFILLYTIFINQKEKNPMPGLPPLVLGSLFGYLLSFIL